MTNIQRRNYSLSDPMIVQMDRYHRDAMTRGSQQLARRINAFLTERSAQA